MAIDLLAWALPAAYVVHLLDETMMNGGFVCWVTTNFWPEYTSRMFFWFNAGAVGAIIASNVMFDLFGGHFIVLPLFWIYGFALHGVTVHVYWTIKQRQYSPGLVTSVLYWIVAYLVARYGYAAGVVSGVDFWTGALSGIVLLGGFLTIGPTWLFPNFIARQAPRHTR
jgi:Protein of unknown function with HXXEE motif